MEFEDFLKGASKNNNDMPDITVVAGNIVQHRSTKKNYLVVQVMSKWMILVDEHCIGYNDRYVSGIVAQTNSTLTLNGCQWREIN